MQFFKFWGSVVALLTGPTVTIALILVGLPGTIGDAMTWLAEWLPTVGSFIKEHAGTLTPAWVLSLVGAALLGWIHLPEMRRSRVASHAKDADPVGDVETSDNEDAAFAALREWCLVSMHDTQEK